MGENASVKIEGEGGKGCYLYIVKIEDWKFSPGFDFIPNSYPCNLFYIHPFSTFILVKTDNRYLGYNRRCRYRCWSDRSWSPMAHGPGQRLGNVLRCGYLWNTLLFLLLRREYKMNNFYMYLQVVQKDTRLRFYWKHLSSIIRRVPLL